MAKFIDLTEIYGNCFTNNTALVHGKIYNNDLLYVSFSQVGNRTDLSVNIHVRRFDGSLTNSGVPLIHWWVSYSGSDSYVNQTPVAPGGGTTYMSLTTGYMIDPTLNTTITNGATLWTSIVNSSSQNATVRFTSSVADTTYNYFLNAMVQGIVYSEKIQVEN